MEVLGEFEYSKKDLIGHGAFAVVFKGRHRKKHDHVVAIKSITKKNLAKSQNLLSKEIKILKELSDLHHENVVALLDCKETSNHVYLVMEYCNGGDLADYLQAKGTLSEDTIASFLRQIAGAMKALNAKGIVHRDLKPQNILLCHEGRTNPPPHLMKLKIADFGFARFLQDGVMAATLCGSPMYMAPEVIMSVQYCAKADLWSVGTIVYQCLTGKAPFQAQTPQQLKTFYEKNANLVPVIPAGTSPHLKDLLYGLLKRNARDRIEFDHFFTHPFHSSGPVRKSVSSSPVPVPRRTVSGTSMSSSPRSLPSVKPVSSSPLSGHMPASPPTADRQKVERSSESMMDVGGGSSHEVAGFLTVQKDDDPILSAPSSSPTEDYVLVPENLPSDHSAGSAGSARPPSSVDLNAIFSDNSPDSTKHKPIHTGSDLHDLSSTSPGRSKPTPMATSSSSSARATSPGQQTSPSRPSSLPVPSPGSSSPHSEPIPVPSQVKAYEQIQRNSPNSPSHTHVALTAAAAISSSPRLVSPVNVPQGIAIPARRNSITDVVSMSPPSVHFTIGTPPSSTWRRASATGTSPNLQGSPLRRSSGTTPPRISTPTLPMVSGATTVLPPILGSPTKTPTAIQFPCTTSRSPTAPLQPPFGSRTKTCPDNLGGVPFITRESQEMIATSPRRLERVATEPYSLARRTSPGHGGATGGGGSKLSEQIIRAAFGSALPSPPSSSGLPIQFPSGGALVPFGSPLHRESSRSSFRERAKSVGERESTPPSMRRRSSSGCGQMGLESPPSSLPYCQSPPNMEGPIQFVAPELAEETLMDKEHNETVAKLNFVLALVDCILELARSRSTPLSESVNQRTADTFTLDHISFVSEGQRRMEQLVLYVRALQLLTSSLQLAREEIKAARLQPSNSVKTVLKEMNENYHHCLVICKDLNNQGVSQCPGINPTSAAVTADKLIYSYAIEMCQTAALDELFGNPQECFRRYRNAQILLHSLAQQAQEDNDRVLLNRYKESVEKRLFNLQSQGFVFAAHES